MNSIPTAFPGLNFGLTHRKSLTLAVLLLLSMTVAKPLNAQRKRGNLGSLRLIDKPFKYGVTDSDSLILVAFSREDKRYFRTYSHDGEFIRSSIVTGRSSTHNRDLLGMLQNENEFLFFFRPSQRANEIEQVSIAKYKKAVTQEELDLAKGKFRVLTSINDRKLLIVLVENRKTKQLGYVRASSEGVLVYQDLQTEEPELGTLLKGEFQFVEEDNELGTESLAGPKKAYPFGGEKYLLLSDPAVTQDKGIIHLFKLDLEANKLTHRRLRNEHTLVSKSVRSYYHRGVLYRLTIERDFLNLSMYDGNGNQVRQFNYGRNDDFNLANSRVYRSGGVSLFASDLASGELTKTKDILRFMDRGKPILKVETRKDDLLELTIGSYNEIKRDETQRTTYMMPFDLGGGTFLTLGIGVASGAVKIVDKSAITRFKSVLTPQFEFTDKTVFVGKPQSPMQDFLRRQDDKISPVLTFPFLPGYAALLIENSKTGETTLYTVLNAY